MLLHTSQTFVPYNYPLAEADVVFLGGPFSATSLSASSRYGPLQIREALRLTEGLPEKHWCDVGDVAIVPGSYELTAQRIKETVAEIRATNEKAFLVVAGGEHLITLPLAEALQPKTIVQVDAHSDTKRDVAGNAYTHQTWAYHASKLCKIFQVGVNAWSKEEMAFVSESSVVHAATATQFLNNDIMLEQPTHLSVDVDCLRGTATGYPEGRLSMKTLRRVLGKVRCTSMDVVEICDDRLPSSTAFAACQVIKAVLEKM